MSLVIALALRKMAVIGADRRSIAFFGPCPVLEEELYSGLIEDDRKLKSRAGELGASLQVSDGREKVWRRGDVLVGEVAEVSASHCRRRRIYLLPGASLEVEIEEYDASFGQARIRSWGGVGCTVFGNRFTQKLASKEISLAGGRVDEALIRAILEKAGRETASVSRESVVLRSDFMAVNAREDLLKALQEDCREGGWRLCDPQ